jgi:hypothetical protein
VRDAALTAPDSSSFLQSVHALGLLQPAHHAAFVASLRPDSSGQAGAAAALAALAAASGGGPDAAAAEGKVGAAPRLALALQLLGAARRLGGADAFRSWAASRSDVSAVLNEEQLLQVGLSRMRRWVI